VVRYGAEPAAVTKSIAAAEASTSRDDRAVVEPVMGDDQRIAVVDDGSVCAGPAVTANPSIPSVQRVEPDNRRSPYTRRGNLTKLPRSPRIGGGGTMAPEVAAAWIGAVAGAIGGVFASIQSHRVEEQKAALQEQLNANESQRSDLLADREAFRRDILADRDAFRQDRRAELEAFRQDVLATRASLRQEELAEKDARREYLYEARKRLYTAVAPTMFQLTELADAGLDGIACLNDPSRRARFQIRPQRREHLTRSGFIGSTSYEVVHSAYVLLCPLAIFRILQRRMTTFDLGVDRQVYVQWCLVRASYQVFQRDKEIAQIDPCLRYIPGGDRRNLRRVDPRAHWLQGVSRGRLDNAIDMLLVEAGEDRVRLATFGQFEAAFERAFETGDDTEKILGVFSNPLFDYDPIQRPVFFRILAVQAVLYHALFESGTRS
jgi:hypothetical protein